MKETRQCPSCGGFCKKLDVNEKTQKKLFGRRQTYTEKQRILEFAVLQKRGPNPALLSQFSSSICGSFPREPIAGQTAASAA